MTHFSEPEWPPQGGQPLQGGQPPQRGQPPLQPGGPYGPPAGAQPGYGQPSYGQPSYGQPSYGQPSYGQPSYGQPPYEQPQYGLPSYSQPQYGQPGGYPPGPGGPGGPSFGPYGAPPPRNKTPWIIGGIAVLVVAGIAVALVLTLGGSSDSSGNAKAAVVTLLKADVNKDLKTARNITCDPLHSQIDESFVQDPDKSYTIGKATQSGDSVTVATTIVDSDNSSHNVVFDVRKQNGTWRVCDVSAGGSGGGGSNTPGGASMPTPSIPTGTDFPSLPTDLPTGGITGSFCITPDGSTPICVPN
jgi:hypothetical protein